MHRPFPSGRIALASARQGQTVELLKPLQLEQLACHGRNRNRETVITIRKCIGDRSCGTKILGSAKERRSGAPTKEEP
nr:hypothetical protein Q903MT_gene2028 [Picea sitchensis]